MLRFRIFPLKFLRGAGRSILEGKSLPIRQVCRSSISTSSRLLRNTDPVFESLRSVASCRVHVGRALDIRVKTSGSE